MTRTRRLRRTTSWLAACAAGFALLISAAVAFDATPVAPARVDSSARLLPLQGGVNFRDLGGYETSDGRLVRRGLLYRSGTMTGLTASDYEYLRTLNIEVVADFRSTEERLREPTRWPGDAEAPRRLERDYELQFGEVLAVMRDAPTPAAARAAFASFYRELPKQFQMQYRQMFDELLAGNAPLAFNCSAGKDRTGVAAALILTALGVPRERVMDDYLLSNKHYKPKPMSAAATDDPTARLFSRLPPDVIQVFMGVESSYLDAAFAGMADEFGSVDKYLEEGLGLDAADREKLRRSYTEPTP